MVAVVAPFSGGRMILPTVEEWTVVTRLVCRCPRMMAGMQMVVGVEGVQRVHSQMVPQGIVQGVKVVLEQV